MTIITNTVRFPEEWKSETGRIGKSILVAGAEAFVAAGRQVPDPVYLVNCDPGLTFELARRSGARGPKLVSLDLVLREPKTWWRKLMLPRRKRLLKRVDHFLNYFRDTNGLERVYGIDPQRCSYIPFKANLPIPAVEPNPGEGDYVLCFGRSLRDFDSFFEAMESIPHVPGAIAAPNPQALREHGARFSRSVEALPKNVRCLPDDQTIGAQVALLTGAAVVVLPVVRGSLVASGISTALNAMLYGKCVIASEGPGVSDIFTDEVLMTPLEDATALAECIEHAWIDGDARRATAARGMARVRGWGGEKELYQRIIDRLTSL